MKLERLISIIMLLLEHKTVTAARLAETFGVSRRTIYRDLDTIDRAGIPIVTHMGANGGVGILEQYKVDKRLFTASDLTALLVGLGGVGSALMGQDVDATLAKVRGLIPRERLAEIEFQSNQIAIDLTPWGKDPRLAEYLEAIKTAMTARRLLAFRYVDAAGGSTSRRVEPYRLLHKGDSWYLQGYCLLRQDMRTFRLYRMSDLTDTDTQFTPRPFVPAALEAAGGGGAPMVEVTFRFHRAIRAEVTGFYGDGAIESDGTGDYLARVMLPDNPTGYSALLYMGELCECLAPEHVRTYIARRAGAMAALYGREAELPQTRCVPQEDGV